MHTPRLGRREALALAAGTAGLAGCLLEDAGTGDAGGSEASRGWPRVGGSVANDWRADADGLSTGVLATVDAWALEPDDSRSLGTPTVVARGDTVAVVGDRNVAVLDADGTRRWREGPPGEDWDWEDCALGPDHLFVWGEDAVLRSFDAQTGERQWRYEEPPAEERDQYLGPDSPFSRRPRPSGVDLLPTSEALVVAFSWAPYLDRPSRVVALDPATGTERWVQEVGGLDGAAVAEDHVVAATNEALLGLDRSDGEVEWRYEPGRIRSERPTIVDGTAVVHASAQDGLAAVDAATGEVQWTAQFVAGSNPVALDGELFVLGERHLYAIDPADGEVRIASESPPDGSRLFAAGGLLWASSSSALVPVTPDGVARQPVEFDRSAGTPAVFGDRLLVPRSGGLVQVFATPSPVEQYLDGAPVPADERVVVVGAEGLARADPDRLRIEHGTTVHVVFAAPAAPVGLGEQPEDADWTLSEQSVERGDAITHEFDVPGTYRLGASVDDGAARVQIEVEPESGEVTVGPNGTLEFVPERVEVPVGTTVTWTWDSENHNVQPTSIPDDAEWEGHPDVVDPPTVYEHIFEEPGRYEYECTPHAAAGMVGRVDVLGPGYEEPIDDGTVLVGPSGDLSFEPAELFVEPGTTVRFEWDSQNHNVQPVEQPADADWAGHPEVVDDPNTHEHTFEEPGVYEYECEPHAAAGMRGRIVVRER